MRLGIFGGSFDPVHNGHVELTRAFYKTLSLDKVIVIPAYISPFKLKGGNASPEQRLEMCRLAFEGFSDTEISDIELLREGASYTYLTLRYLSEVYGGDELFLITGADSFLTIQNWKRPEEIFSRAVICSAPRNSDDSAVLEAHAEYLHSLGARTELCNIRVMTVSSTEIRKRVKTGKSIKGLVPEKVEEYIYKNAVYL